MEYFNEINHHEAMMLANEMITKQKVIFKVFASTIMPWFCESSLFRGLILRLREREIRKCFNAEFQLIPSLPSQLRTVAYEQDNYSENFWLELFVCMSEGVSVGMVVADMRTSGQPILYVNEAFEHITGHGKEKIGSNYSFIFGVDLMDEKLIQAQSNLQREAEAALRNHETIILKIWHAKADGSQYPCLVALHPIFDLNIEESKRTPKSPKNLLNTEGNNVFKYTVAVLIETGLNADTAKSLLEIDRVLRSLPKSLCGYRSSENEISLSMNGYPNNNNILYNLDISKGYENTNPTVQNSANDNRLASMENLDNSIDPATTSTFSNELSEAAVEAFTKIIWMQDPLTTCRLVLMNPDTRLYFSRFASKYLSALARTQIEFIDQALTLISSLTDKRLDVVKSLQRSTPMLPLCSCSSLWLEDLLKISDSDWLTILSDIRRWMELIVSVLSGDAFTHFLGSNEMSLLIKEIRRRELANEDFPLRTSARHTKNDSRQWIDMFSALGDNLSLGMAMADMKASGQPLLYVNDGFKRITGYGKEKIGSNYRFVFAKDLNNNSSEQRNILGHKIADEAIVSGKEALFKVENMMASGRSYQCLIRLHPVYEKEEHTQNETCKYYIAMILNAEKNDIDLMFRLSEIYRVCR